jgi:tripartite-type tricarboxylate transporter receptor subunit TctC
MKKLLATLALGLATLAAQAQAWPTKTVTLVVPFPPGGSTETLARALGPKLQDELGQTFIVDNKAGATGTIGAAQVKRSAADGYTFLVTSLGPLVIAPHLLNNVPYDAAKDFDLLTVAVQAPNMLVVPANSDLLGGQVDASFQNVNAVLQHINAGKLKALAATGDKRSPVLPDMATLGEAGVKGVDVYSWQAVVAQKGLPPEVKTKMHAALVAALDDPKLKQQFVGLGFEIVASAPEQFAAFQQRESARWKQLIDTRKITVD